MASTMLKKYFLLIFFLFSCSVHQAEMISLLSSSSMIAINYINRGDYPQKFDYAVWKLGLFLCSDVKLPSTGKYHVKCIECHWVNDFGGTNPLAHHAETKHQDLPRVAKWMAEKRAIAAAKREQKEANDTHLIQEMKDNGLDGFLRPIKKEEARRAPPEQLLKQWKFTAPPALALTKAVADFILLDGHPASIVEGEGFQHLLHLTEPRYVCPSRTYFQHVCASMLCYGVKFC